MGGWSSLQAFRLVIDVKPPGWRWLIAEWRPQRQNQQNYMMIRQNWWPIAPAAQSRWLRCSVLRRASIPGWILITTQEVWKRFLILPSIGTVSNKALGFIGTQRLLECVEVKSLPMRSWTKRWFLYRARLFSPVTLCLLFCVGRLNINSYCAEIIAVMEKI